MNPIPTTEGYGSWAGFYDEPGNQLIDLEQPIVREILDGLPRGVALDAACGTGRHSAYLASLGHTVIGVDSSVAMLARAREKVPGGEFLAMLAGDHHHAIAARAGIPFAATVGMDDHAFHSAEKLSAGPFADKPKGRREAGNGASHANSHLKPSPRSGRRSARFSR